MAWDLYVGWRPYVPVAGQRRAAKRLAWMWQGTQVTPVELAGCLMAQPSASSAAPSRLPARELTAYP
jgi:hypothetical protein